MSHALILCHIPLRQSLSRHLELSWQPAGPSSPYAYLPPSWGPGVHSPFRLLECLGFELTASRLGNVLFSFPVATTTHPDESDLREKGLIDSVPGNGPPWWGKEASRSSCSRLIPSQAAGRAACCCQLLPPLHSPESQPGNGAAQLTEEMKITLTDILKGPSLADSRFSQVDR